MRVLSVDPINSGLNNQRIALLGLITAAQEAKCHMVLPAGLIDFTPKPKSEQPDASTMLPLSEIFDEEVLRLFLNKIGVLSDQTPTEELDFHHCFRRGNSAIRRIKVPLNGISDIAFQFLENCRPARPLWDLAMEIVESFEDKEPTALQLRIERDWKEYLVKRHGNTSVRTPSEDLTTDVDRIFSKISANSVIASHPNILVCCDEADLSVSKNKIIAAGLHYGFHVMFKSTYENTVLLPESRLKRSMIDFSICTKLTRYVGLTRSTFSNMLCLVKSLSVYPNHPEHYIYNNPEDCAARRTDWGLEVDPLLATTGFR